MILLIDNYDSFSYNLVQMAGSINPDIKVIRNDELTVEEIENLHPDKIILSPGPGYPKDAGVCEEVVQKLQGKFPIMGVCLGHQAICEAYGGEIIHAKELMHGKKSNVKIDTASPIFQGMPEEIDAARYHSLAADTEKIPRTLKVIATADGSPAQRVSGVRITVSSGIDSDTEGKEDSGEFPGAVERKGVARIIWYRTERRSKDFRYT